MFSPSVSARDAVAKFRQVITIAAHTHYIGAGTIAEQAAELCARYNLSLTDAFQVAAALAAKSEAFLMNDLTLKPNSAF
jgi:predicted nucleic acid-binding protein